MTSLRQLRAVRSASVAANIVMATGAISCGTRPDLAWLYLSIVMVGGLGLVVVRRGRPHLGAVIAVTAGLFCPWYALGLPSAETSVVTAIGWLVLAMCMAAVTLRPLLFVAFASANAGILYGLVELQSAVDAPTRWALGGLYAVLTVSGAVVAWQRRRLVGDVERQEAELRAAEQDARQRAAAAEAARERLERAHTELVTRSRTAVVGELSTAIGHEINNPLMAIVMATEDLAARRPGDPDVGVALDVIRDATERCRGVVGRLLSHADVRAARPVPLDFAAITRDALGLTRRHLQEVGATIELDLDGPIEVSGDEGELGQLVFNLLMFVASREPSRVVVRGGTNASHAWLAIRDDGPPMAEVQRAAAFQPMLSGEPSPMLGLALCRTLVRRYGGQVALASSAAGCTFTVALPRPGGTSPP